MKINSQTYKIKGMRRDESYSSFSPEFSWENHNIRLTAMNSNDLLGLTNERGNSLVSHTEEFKKPARIRIKFDSYLCENLKFTFKCKLLNDYSLSATDSGIC